jgi:5-methylcytosine-specific restriction protein A
LTLGEIDDSPTYPEGAKKLVTVNAYERSKKARLACIKHYGAECCVCGLSLEDRYGKIAKNVVHVHHLKALASLDASYEVNPVEDLRPVCPNCHTVIHLRTPPFTPAEIRHLIETSGSNVGA